MKKEELPRRTQRTRRGIICALLGAVLLLPVLSCNKLQEEFVGKPWSDYSPLHEVYTDYFLLGNIIRDTGDFSNATRSGILKRHYKIVTAENHMKPNYIAPDSNGGAYKWTTADNIVNYALANGFVVHGHTLIWHSQTPSWLTNGTEQAVLVANLEKYVTDVVTHFKGKIISWDVVNEAFQDSVNSEPNAGNWRNFLRNSPWNKAGNDYIEKAFRAARAADPDAKLYYNDFGLNSIGKRLATYYMVKEINENWRGEGNSRLLIEGIGMQSHHNNATDPESVRASIEKFIELDVEIGITELDMVANNGGSVSDPRLGGAWNEDVAKKQAAQYAAMFRIFKDYAEHITRVTFWGLDDGTSWRSPNNPTLLDRNFVSKPAFEAVMNPSRY